MTRWKLKLKLSRQLKWKPWIVQKKRQKNLQKKRQNPSRWQILSLQSQMLPKEMAKQQLRMRVLRRWQTLFPQSQMIPQRQKPRLKKKLPLKQKPRKVKANG